MSAYAFGRKYLLAADAAGRKGDVDKAAEYINVIRKRAACAESEQQDQQIWLLEGGVHDTKSTYDALKRSPADL
jgi:SusD family.